MKLRTAIGFAASLLGCHSMEHYAPADGHAPTYHEVRATVDTCRREARHAPRDSVAEDLRQSLAWFVFPVGIAQRRERYEACMAARGWERADGYPRLAPIGGGQAPVAAGRTVEAPPADPPLDAEESPAVPEASRDAGDWIEVTGPDGTRLLYNPETLESVVLPD